MSPIKDARITISDPAGMRTKVDISGETLFELARLRLPTSTAEMDTAVVSCGGGCSHCSQISLG
jgi:hypothetical protein